MKQLEMKLDTAPTCTNYKVTLCTDLCYAGKKGDYIPPSVIKKKRRAIIPMLNFLDLLDQFEGRRVEVYYNLHKKVFSVRCMKSKLVLAHCDDIIPLRDVTFKVSETGRQRVLAEKRKNVHAFVQGTISQFHDCNDTATYNVVYNPYRFKNFMASTLWPNEDGKFNASPIHKAPWTIMLIQSKTNKPFIRAYDDMRNL